MKYLAKCPNRFRGPASVLFSSNYRGRLRSAGTDIWPGISIMFVRGWEFLASVLSVQNGRSSVAMAT